MMMVVPRGGDDNDDDDDDNDNGVAVMLFLMMIQTQFTYLTKVVNVTWIFGDIYRPSIDFSSWSSFSFSFCSLALAWISWIPSSISFINVLWSFWRPDLTRKNNKEIETWVSNLCKNLTNILHVFICSAVTTKKTFIKEWNISYR